VDILARQAQSSIISLYGTDNYGRTVTAIRSDDIRLVFIFLAGKKEDSREKDKRKQ
jgi:hypothetical protein